jgi:hypothetical protein
VVAREDDRTGLCELPSENGRLALAAAPEKVSGADEMPSAEDRWYEFEQYARARLDKVPELGQLLGQLANEVQKLADKYDRDITDKDGLQTAIAVQRQQIQSLVAQMGEIRQVNDRLREAHERLVWWMLGQLAGVVVAFLLAAAGWIFKK